MKFFTLPALLAAALVSLIVAVPFLPTAKMRPDLFMLEARLTTNTSGRLHVYYDNGTGFSEALSATADISGGPASYRLPLPTGTYTALRFDPLEGAGTVQIHSLRVIALAGRTLRALNPAEFRAGQQIQSLRPQNGALEVVMPPGSDDPQLLMNFAAPLVVQASLGDYVRGASPFVVPVFLGLALSLFVLDRGTGLRRRIVQSGLALAARPTRLVCLAAAVAVVASAYPIVFLGKSYVSPNLGTILLYDNYPTLPGYHDSGVADVKLSDVGAVMWQHVPFSMIQRRALAHGELPLWNRYNAAGVPLLAQGQSMFGDPLHFLVIAANGAAWAWDLKYLIAKWLFAAGLGLTVLALLGPRREETTGGNFVFAATLVAAAAPFIGFFLYRVNHPAFFSLCYAPWPLFCLVRIAQAPSVRSTALWCLGLAIANLALMNSGTVKEAYMLLACVNFSGGCILLALPHSRERSRKIGAVAWTGLLFVLFTAPIWSTFLQTLKNAYTGYNAVSAYQIQPSLLLGLFDEIFYRPLMEENRVFSPSLNFLLLLGLLYFLATLRTHFANRAVVALAASSLLPLALAFGLISPLWIVKLPFLGNIAHLDNTFSCVLIVLWSVLAGVGFATAAERLGTREGKADLIIAGLLLGALVFGWIGFRQASHRPIFGAIFSVHLPGKVLAVDPFIWQYLAVLLVASAVLAWLVREALVGHGFTPGRTLLIALCALALIWRHGAQAGAVGFETFTFRPSRRVDFHARSGAVEFARAAQAREPGRGFGFQGHFFPGWTATYGLETIHGPDALVNPYLRQLVDVSGLERMWDWRIYVDLPQLAAARPFLDALNVRYYFDMKTSDPMLMRTLHRVHTADLDVYESPSAWPRAFFTDRVELYDQPAEVIAKFRAANGQPFAMAQRSDHGTRGVLSAIPTDLATRNAVPATNYHLTENNTSFVVRATGPGVIVLTEAYWPGDFRVEVNGRKTSVLRLNHAFKGVLVPQAGEYRVDFRYWPRNFWRNLGFCGIGTGAGLLSLFLALRPGSTRTRPHSSLQRVAGGAPAVPSA